MKTLRLTALLALATLAGCTQTWVHSQYQQPDRFANWVDATPTEYRIQPGDELSIVLPLNAELNYRGTVSPDGALTMPFAGTVPAAGLSVAQFAAGLDKALAANNITAHAYPSVSIVESAAHVFVGGQVAKPGVVPLKAGMSVMQAIIAAQGLNDMARSGEIVLVRRSPDGRPMLRTVDIDALTQRGDPSQDVVLQASDTIFVPKSSVAEVDQWVSQYINQALPFSRSVDLSITNNPAGVR
ncbi:polysaccharide biosynthesis/export family protein [Caballeronia sp. M23-90]